MQVQKENKITDEKHIFIAAVLAVSALCTGAHAADCPSGTAAVSMDSATIISLDSVGRCPGGYEVYESPSHISGLFGGAFFDSGVTLCDDGYYMNNGTCTAFSQGRCDANYYESTVGSGATVSAVDGVGRCSGGYSVQDITTGSYIISTGIVLSNTVTLCNDGYYMNNGTCTAYSSTMCPENWVDYAPTTTATFVPAVSGACDTNYTLVGDSVGCEERGNDDFCATFCAAGESVTWDGYCVPVCTAGVTEFHIGSLVFPVYSTKTTSPALHVKLDSGDVCYVNLATGAASGALNVKDSNGTTYHVTK